MEYTSLTDVPLQQDIRDIREYNNLFSEFQRATHYRFGEFDTLTKTLKNEMEHKDELYHKLDARVRKVEQDARAAEVSRRAIGDYVKDIDRYGSRRWVAPAE